MSLLIFVVCLFFSFAYALFIYKFGLHKSKLLCLCQFSFVLWAHSLFSSWIRHWPKRNGILLPTLHLLKSNALLLASAQNKSVSYLMGFYSHAFRFQNSSKSSRVQAILQTQYYCYVSSIRHYNGFLNIHFFFAFECNSYLKSFFAAIT